jgi:hypothetical protein
MINFDRAFTTKGISLQDEVGIFGGEEDPTTTDPGVPKGSFFLRTDGTVWVKVGDTVDSWVVMPTTAQYMLSVLFGQNIHGESTPVGVTGVQQDEIKISALDLKEYLDRITKEMMSLNQHLSLITGVDSFGPQE